MPYRNKTYVAFASEDINHYWMMTAWRKNKNIGFDFLDAHDINTARDTSEPETIRRRLRERLAHTNQAVVLISDTTRLKGNDPSSFLYYELETIAKLGLPVIFANINKSKAAQTSKIPDRLGSPYYTISIPLRARIMKYALDEYIEEYNTNSRKDKPRTGPHTYKDSVYKEIYPNE